jgi:hypothetical protein
VYRGEPMTGDEIWEKYGLDFDNIPKIHAHITFKVDSESESRYLTMLKAIIKHGKLNKDARGGKRIAIEYAFKFDNTQRTLSELGISVDEVKDILGNE